MFSNLIILSIVMTILIFIININISFFTKGTYFNVCPRCYFNNGKIVKECRNCFYNDIKGYAVKSLGKVKNGVIISGKKLELSGIDENEELSIYINFFPNIIIEKNHKPQTYNDLFVTNQRVILMFRGLFERGWRQKEEFGIESINEIKAFMRDSIRLTQPTLGISLNSGDYYQVNFMRTLTDVSATKAMKKITAIIKALSLFQTDIVVENKIKSLG